MKNIFIILLAALSISFSVTNAFTQENEKSDNNNVANLSDPDDKDPHFSGGTDKSDNQSGNDNNSGALNFKIGGSMDNQMGFGNGYNNSHSK